MPDYLRSLKVIGVTIHLVKPIDVYLHHPGQFLTWNIYSLTSRLGEQTFVDVAQEVTRNQMGFLNYEINTINMLITNH